MRVCAAGSAVLEGSAVLAGLATILRNPRLRVLSLVYGIDVLTQAMLDVLLVIAGIELLALGEQGVAWLNAAWGVGGIIGGVAATLLLARGRLSAGLLLGAVAIGGSLVAIAGWPRPVPALCLLVVLGIGFAVLEIAHLNLTQRQVPADVLARVYGV